MADSIFQFQADLRKLAEIVDINIGTVVQKVATDLFTSIVKRTPVDTGRARAGWGLSIGTAAVPTKPAGTYSEAKGEPGQYPTGLAIPDVSSIDGTQVVYILNNVEYVPFLEAGSSKQAPNGMVKLALMEAETEINKIILEAQ